MSNGNKTDDFGKNVVLLRGWDFKPSDYQEAWKNGRLLTAQIETSNLCDLACEYCFREELGAKSKKRLPGEISVEDTKQVIDDLIDLGSKTINIIGAGEPTVDLAFPELLDYIAEKQVIPVVFTHGGRLTESLIDKLQETNSSVIIKVNSFNPAVQDQLVNRYGYTEKRDRDLRLLIEAGFNQPRDNHQTRLGIDSVVCQDNKTEILDIHKYCRNNNIMPLIKTFIPAGRTKDRTDIEISMREFLELSKQVRDIDRKEYGIQYQRLIPYLGGVPCTQCGKASMYVTILGDIFECPGQQSSYGNIGDTSVREAFQKIRDEQENYNFGCPPRISYWKRTNQIKRQP